MGIHHQENMSNRHTHAQMFHGRKHIRQRLTGQKTIDILSHENYSFNVK
jgi:hypothetical protein